MNQSQKRTMKWEIISTLVLNIIILVLATLKVFSWGFFIGFLIFTIFLTLILFSIFIFVKKRSEDITFGEETKSAIEEAEALNMAKMQLYDLKILEKVSEEIRKGIRYEGEDKDNIYEYLVRGSFSQLLYSILINMRTKEINCEKYNDTKIIMETIDNSIDKRANRLSRSPKDVLRRDVTTESPFTGVRQTVREEIIKEKEGKETKEEGLQ